MCLILFLGALINLFPCFVNRAIFRLKCLILAIPLFLPKRGDIIPMLSSKGTLISLFLVKLCKTSKTFTSVVKVVPLSYFEELLIRNRAMCIILFLGHIYFVVLVKKRAVFRAESIVFCPDYYFITANRGSIVPLFT